MAQKKNKNLRYHKKDSTSTLIEKNEKLLRKVDRLEKEIKKLRSDNKTLRDAWEKTEEYIQNISKNKNIEDIFEEIEYNTHLRKKNKSCPNCGAKRLNKMQFNSFHLEVCNSCTYRNRINE